MKKINYLMSAVAFVCGTMMMTSCQGFVDAVFGEEDKPSETTKPTTDPETPAEPTDLETPLTFEAVSGTISVIVNNTNTEAKTLEYSTDEGKTWTSLTVAAEGKETIPAAAKVQLRGNNASYGVGNFAASGTSTSIYADADYYVYGNVMSLVDKENFATNTTLTGDWAFFYLFWNADDNGAQLKNHPDKELVLPATTLTEGCYCNMFVNCVALTKAPKLPAKTLKTWCYYQMFDYCLGLTEAPELPATALAFGCYMRMFLLCKNLTKAPELPATTLANSCYEGMFSKCIALATAPELPAKSLKPQCYYGMFSGCAALTEAPELSATAMNVESYGYMFEDCSALTKAPELPATTLDDNCYWFMFYGCTALETAPELPATTLAEQCYGFMFNGCSALTKAPELKAKTLAAGSYKSMFLNCSKLSEVKCHAIDISAEDCLLNWMDGVAATGDFYKDTSMTTFPTGVSGIPTGWTEHDL